MKPIIDIIKNIGKSLAKNSPSILTGIGCVGVVTTAVASAKAVRPARINIKEFARDYGITEEDLSLWEKFKASWKVWIPTIISGASSITCIIFANVINLKRGAALAALYTMSQETLHEYEKRVIRKIGKNKNEEIKDEIITARGKKPNKNNIIYSTGKGNYLFKDTFTGTYFRSDIDKVREAFLDLNDKMWKEDYVSLGDLKDFLKIKEKGKYDEDLGWRMENGKVSYDMAASIDDEYKEPIIYISYNIQPKENYFKVY